MKATSRMRKGKFTLTITIDDESEAQALYAIFNYTSNCDLVGEQNAQGVKHAIGDQFYVCDLTQEIANGITYGKFYVKKVNEV